MLLGELAHELRNPMVTVKTFAQHLDSVVADPETRARFGALTGEAISRMDALLERLLDFARFGTPIPQPFDLYALLVRAVEERADELARKDVRLQHTRGVRMLVDADESQVTFALRSLVDGLVDHVVPRTPLRAVAGASGDVMLALGVDRAVASRLAAYVAGGTRSATGLPPLVLALATALIRRNRGRLDTRVDDEGTTVITVALPRTAAGVA
jgi:polar amino acid transport system substrate-binding protein